MTSYNLTESIQMIKDGHKLKYISLILKVPYSTLYDALRREGYRIKECRLDEIAIYSYKNGTAAARSKFNVSPKRLATIRYNLRRKHSFKLTYAELGDLKAPENRRVDKLTPLIP